MDNTVKLWVDGIQIQADKEYTILQACRENNIDIPTLCYLEDLPPDGACRLCLVEVEGARGLMTACSTPVTEGMAVHTRTNAVIEARKDVLDLLLSTHKSDCFNCKKLGQCKFYEYCEEYGLEHTGYSGENAEYEIDASNPFFEFNKNKCILCRKCARICKLLQCSDVYAISRRGFNTHITPEAEKELEQSPCVSCGNCVSYCPTGALVPKRAVSAVGAEKTLTTCPYCGVGCQMYLAVKNGKIIDVEPAYGEANQGLLCVKGKFGSKFVSHPDRLKTPLIKKNGKFTEATWEEAYDLIASKILETRQKYGADAIMGVSSAKCTNEENYVFQKMMRAAIGTNNVDHCARLCHASTVAGLAATLGSGAMTNPIGGILDADLIFVTGSNTTEAHPVIGSKIRQAVRRGARLIVADPRRIDLVNDADLFLQIKPGTNIALYNGMLNVIIEEGLLDESYINERTENFGSVKTLAAEYPPEKAAEICGIDAGDLRAAAKMYASADKAAIFYAMGVTQFTAGTKGVMAISNLALAAGKLGKDSSGVNPLRGQNNVQGACDMGALPGDFPGYQKVTDPEARKKFARAWGVETLSGKPGYELSDMFDHFGESIKLLYLMGENPLLSDADINHCIRQIEKLDFFVAQDIFLTETAQFADVVLPAAAFAEKDGTFTNTERRIQRVRKAVAAPGSAKPDSEILCEITKRLGYTNTFSSPSEIMDEIASVTPSYSGVSYGRLDNLSGLIWPCPSRDHPGTPVLYKERFSRQGGKAAFALTPYAQPNELPDEGYPFVLTTGRVLYQFHTRTMTGKVDGLNKKAGRSIIEINPADAGKLKITDNEKVKVKSRRGEITTTAKVTDKVAEGVVFIPFHYADGPANALTNPVVDDIAKIPELKVCACQIEKL